MKNLLFILGLLSIGLFASCGGGASEAECCGADGECCKEGDHSHEGDAPEGDASE